MRHFLILIVCAAASLAALAGPRQSSGEGHVVVTSTKKPKPHLVDVAEPEATHSSASLTVTLDATHYASYRVKLTAPSGDTVAVSATSSTVTIPVTGTTAGLFGEFFRQTKIHQPIKTERL
ncbi:MAG: hypothetical protein IKR25_07315 [Muribaculaceae bacterium]|nr:hypothetical protein [Muribaculaceae bacterium]